MLFIPSLIWVKECWLKRANSFDRTMVQNNQESRHMYWAPHSSIRSFACTAHSFNCSALLVLLACSAELICLLVHSLFPKLVGKWMISCWDIRLFWSIVDHYFPTTFFRNRFLSFIKPRKNVVAFACNPFSWFFFSDDEEKQVWESLNERYDFEKATHLNKRNWEKLVYCRPGKASFALYRFIQLI